MTWQIDSVASEQTVRFGELLGRNCPGGSCIELRSDLGGGKTTLCKGIARGLGITEPITSPTFTISREYQAQDNLFLHHYDLYRLDQAGILATEIQESLNDERVITVVEWAGSVTDILPESKIIVELAAKPDNIDARTITVHYPEVLAVTIKHIETQWTKSEYLKP